MNQGTHWRSFKGFTRFNFVYSDLMYLNFTKPRHIEHTIVPSKSTSRAGDRIADRSHPGLQVLNFSKNQKNDLRPDLAHSWCRPDDWCYFQANLSTFFFVENVGQKKKKIPLKNSNPRSNGQNLVKISSNDPPYPTILGSIKLLWPCQNPNFIPEPSNVPCLLFYYYGYLACF